MAQFKYSAIDGSGKSIRGCIEANSKPEAFSSLKARGLSPLSVREERPRPVIFRSNRIKSKDLALVTRQLAVLLSAGVKLPDAVSSLANGASNPAIAEKARLVQASMRAGTKFSVAMRQEFPAMPHYVPQMAELGETTGQLGAAMTEAADQYENDLQIAAEVRTALTYPMFLVVSGGLIVALMFIFVVPQFAELITKSDANVPYVSGVVIGISLWFRDNWMLVIVFLIVIIGAGILTIRNFRGGIAAVLEQLPIIRKFLSVSTLATWCRTLGGALKHGAGLIPALELAERGVMSPRLRAGFASVRQAVRSGESLDDALTKYLPDFDKIAIDMIRTGQKSGKLDEMLLFAANVFRTDTQERTKRLTALVEPLAIIIISFVVGTIVISIVLAMTSLYEISP